MTTTPSMRPAGPAAFPAGQPYVTARRPGRLDTALVINVMICLLVLVPAWLILPGTTDVGRPALVVCVGLFFWWAIARVNPWLTPAGPQPIRWAVLGYYLSLLVSYATGFLRGLTQMEANSADRWMISAIAFAGVILATADGVATWNRLGSIIRVLVSATAVMAGLGLAQYVLAVDVVRYLAVPGLEPRGWVPDVQDVARGLRVASTTAHYIELSAVLAMVLPFGIHLARFAATRRARQLFAAATLVIAAGLPVTISRTGLAAALVAVFALVPLWNWRLRFNMLVLGAVLGALLAVAKPSLARTLLDLFLNLGSDPSVTARTERYAMVGHFFGQRPWLGRGTGTWVPPQYQYLDNQWLATALCTGLVGVAALAAVHITALSLALVALRRSRTAEDRHLCAVLVATQLVAVFVAATFDSMWFSTYPTILALTVGLCGAVWRLTHPAPEVRAATANAPPARPTARPAPPTAPPDPRERGAADAR